MLLLMKRVKKVYLLAQGYMPAQDIHVLKNPVNASLSHWYAVNVIPWLLKPPEYTFMQHE
jgi:hypothetical protein